MKRKYTKPRNNKYRWVCKRRARKLRQRGEWVRWDENAGVRGLWYWIPGAGGLLNGSCGGYKRLPSMLGKSSGGRSYQNIPRTIVGMDFAELEKRCVIAMVSGQVDALTLDAAARRYFITDFKFRGTQTGRIKSDKGSIEELMRRQQAFPKLSDGPKPWVSPYGPAKKK